MLSDRIGQGALLALTLNALACDARRAERGNGLSQKTEAVAEAPPAPASRNGSALGGLAPARSRMVDAPSFAPSSGPTAAFKVATSRGPEDAVQRVHRDSSATPAMIIRNGSTSIEVDSLDRAVARVRAIASRLGGFVANTSAQTGRDQVHSSTLELRIPSARFDEAVSGLLPVGHVEGVNISAEDVGEEYVDVAARVANARRLEARLIELLATQTGKLVEMLAVERELARVREEIERYEGRLRYLKAHTAMSSLAVTLHEPLPIIAVAAHNPFVQALRDAWRNFVSLLATAIALLGYVLPLGAMAAAVFVTVRRLRVRPAVP
jgi:hypothetical protein